MKRPPIHSILALLLLGAIVSFVALLGMFSATFGDYSRRFGALSPAEFTALNERMDWLQRGLRATLVTGTLFDAALLLAAARALAHEQRAGAVLIFAVVSGILIAFVWLLTAMPFAPMIG
jgi:hypothetical protein